MAMTLEELQILITSETSGLKKELASVKQQLGQADKEVRKATASIGKALKGLGAIAASVFAVKKIVDFGRASVQAFGATSVEVAKLEQVMRNTMSATDAQIASVKALTQAQEGLGVISSGIQLAGSQELGTYLSQVESLKILIPTMNDMLAQQYGLDATEGAAVNIGSMIGKVMDGQLGALSRYGYSWTDEQEKVLKYGNELERAAMLAEVIGQSVGGMNEELAKTPLGQMKQLQFTMSAIKDEIGQGLMSAISAVMPYIQRLVDGLLRIAQYFRALMTAIFGATNAQVAHAQASSRVADAQEDMGDSAEEAGKKAKGATTGFDEINQLAEKSSDGGSASWADIGSFGDSATWDIPEINTDKLENDVEQMINNIKAMFRDMWNQISGYGGKIKDAFSGIRPALQPLIDMRAPIVASLSDIGSTFKRLTEQTLKPMADYFLLDFIPKIVTGFVKSFAPIFADVAIWSVELFAKTFRNVTDIVNRLWNTVWFPSLEKLKNAYLDVFPKIADSIQKLLDGTIKPFVDYVLNGFILPIAEALNRTLVPILTDVTVWAFREMAKAFDWAVNMMNDVWETVLRPIFELIKGIVLDTLQIITDLWDEYGVKILDNISILFEGIRNTFQQLWDVILKPIIEPFLDMLSWLWDKHIKGLIAQAGEFVMKLINAALEIYNKFIQPLIHMIIGLLGPAFVTGFNFVVDVIGSAVAMIADVIAGLLKILGGLIDFILGVFTGDWKRAWEGVRSIFKGIFDSLWGIVKFPLNLIIDGINTVISGLNKISFSLPDWDILGEFAGMSFGINIPPIPKLARGGIVDSPTLAMIGEAGKEAVVPLENTSFVNTLASALGTAVMGAMQMQQSTQQGQSNNSGDVIIQLDGTTLARVLNPYLSQESQRLGSTIIQPI